jgi:polysaccharide deacetylase 2 family uncharacterized protein YibQ
LKSPGAAGIKNKIFNHFLHETPHPKKNNSSRNETSFLVVLNEILEKLGTNTRDSTQFAIRKFIDASSPKDTVISLSARVPKGYPSEWIVWNISKATENTTYGISDCAIEEKKQRCTFTFSSPDWKTSSIRLAISRSERFVSGASKIAIIGEIVDDSAYQTVVAYLSIPERMCVSLLPGRKQSTLIAQLAGQYHKEVLIRLPLEPATKIPSGFTSPVIMVHFSRDNIRSIISQATISVPHFSGFINFWGSRALEDSRVMEIVLSEIKGKRSFFIEEKTTKNSMTMAMAESIGVPYEEAIGAISDKKRQVDIEKQLKAFCASAQLSGAIIITAPITPTFIAVLKASLPWMRKNGVLLAFPSELVNKQPE